MVLLGRPKCQGMEIKVGWNEKDDQNQLKKHIKPKITQILENNR